MKCFLILFSLYISFFIDITRAYAFQNTEEIYVQMKDNSPCIYIEPDNSLTGNFDLTVTDSNGLVMLYNHYSNHNIQNDFPNKNNCKLLNANNFSNFKNLEDNKVYVSHLVTADQPHRIFRGHFCLQTENGKKLSEPIKNNQCLTTTYEEKPSLLKRLIEIIRSFFD